MLLAVPGSASLHAGQRQLTKPTRGCRRADCRSTLFLSKVFLGAAWDSGKKVKVWSCWRTRLCSSWKMAMRFPSLPDTFSNWNQSRVRSYG